MAVSEMNRKGYGGKKGSGLVLPGSLAKSILFSNFLIHNRENFYLSPEASELLLLGPLSVSTWTLFSCHLVQVINMFLLLHVCFLDGL